MASPWNDCLKLKIVVILFIWYHFASTAYLLTSSSALSSAVSPIRLAPIGLGVQVGDGRRPVGPITLYLVVILSLVGLPEGSHWPNFQTIVFIVFKELCLFKLPMDFVFFTYILRATKYLFCSYILHNPFSYTYKWDRTALHKTLESQFTILPPFINWPWISYYFLKWAIPGLFFILFSSFFKQTLQFLQQINVKKCPSGISARIRTHKLRNMSLLP